MKWTVILSLSMFATLQAFAGNACRFGDDIEDLYKNTAFEVQKDAFRTFKISREGSAELKLVSIDVVKDLAKKRTYHLCRTDMDKYDGGNTVGWIEEVTDMDNEHKDAGQVVALISDSVFNDCK